MEYYLGMICDFVGGYVIIFCIERNVICVVRVINIVIYCMFIDGKYIISFDEVIKIMKEIGKDMCFVYKEIFDGGFVKYYDRILVDSKE